MVRDARPDLVKTAICSGTLGQVQWKPACVEKMLADPKMAGFTQMGVRAALRELVLKERGNNRPKRGRSGLA